MKKSKRLDKKEEPFVSVLTPVYNGDAFLGECIESVLNQDYDNWEYVIVNNCSTDDSLKIAKSYAKQDSRIRIHDNETFLEQMENLNRAFKQISPDSKYCKVLHADDLLFPECVRQMVQLAEENPSIGFVSAYQQIDKKVGPNGLEYPQQFFPGKEFGKRYLSDEMKLIAHPSANLIRSNLIHKREKVYDESYLSSDTSAFLDILSESDFGFIYQVLTYTRLHEDSVTNTEVKIYIYLLDLLRVNLKFAPIFLTDVKARQVIEKRERIFYIQFARSLLLENTGEVYNELSNELKKMDQPIKYGKLFLYLIRELLLQPIKAIGIK